MFVERKNMINLYDANVSSWKIIGNIREVSVIIWVSEPLFSLIISSGGDHMLEVFALSFLCICNQKPWSETIPTDKGGNVFVMDSSVYIPFKGKVGVED